MKRVIWINQKQPFITWDTCQAFLQFHFHIFRPMKEQRIDGEESSERLCEPVQCTRLEQNWMITCCVLENCFFGMIWLSSPYIYIYIYIIIYSCWYWCFVCWWLLLFAHVNTKADLRMCWFWIKIRVIWDWGGDHHKQIALSLLVQS